MLGLVHGAHYQNLEFDFGMNESPIPLYLQCGLYIYHGDEYENIDDVVSNKAFEPNLVSDFVNVNWAKYSQAVYWCMQIGPSIHGRCGVLVNVNWDRL